MLENTRVLTMSAYTVTFETICSPLHNQSLDQLKSSFCRTVLILRAINTKARANMSTEAAKKQGDVFFDTLFSDKKASDSDS
jgi:hypothetical protein